ncbi:PSD1 and planctomycete cytochrome C domain-containing protein [Luteolibacter marinus]|uniref:PSD1 and planctomycete cytochrome C domain-containing protein n=1 Tax=Luteolibacter marinus TaxID=2776705 RepID=UPI0018662D76|nr:PSD1 and planctomycete cytochrome C domain-containing protein [Luteolibacter marinus]
MSKPELVVLLLMLQPATWAAERLSYNRDVRPVLSKNCFSCHGPDEHGREAELRLDLVDSALEGGESGKPAIVPGKPGESLLVKRIYHSSAKRLMPPPDSHRELSPDERDLLKRWVEEGAVYEGHWAFTAPVKAELPAGADVNPIDRFVAAKLVEEGLGFSAEADRRTLLRRLSFDLTGLPPTLEELAAFVADPSPDAYERQVDRLLASPRFGEQQAVAWLDAARYADTNGYSIDGGRHQWLWRDWVIKAFNDNKPYDVFLTEQLAGDLLPDATEQQLVASGFNRNNANTHEGGTIAEENLVNYVADRVKTTSEVFLGLTMACAQCHDHKFDPIPQRDYYRFFAFFNTVGDAPHDGDGGVNSRPSIQARSCLSTPEEIAAVEASLNVAREALSAADPAGLGEWVAAQREDLAKAGADLMLHPLIAESATSPNGNPERIRIEDDGSVSIAGGDYAAYNVMCRLPQGVGPVAGIRVEFLPTDAAGGKLGYSGVGGLEGNLVMSTLTTSASSFPALNVDLNASLPMARISASASQPGFGPALLRDTTPTNGWAPPTGSTAPQHVTVTFGRPLDPAASPYLTTELMFIYGGGASPARFRIHAFTGADDGSPHPAEITALLKAGPEAWSPEQQGTIASYFRDHAPAKAAQRTRVAELEERLAVLTQAHPVMVMNTAENPRVTHILDRGVYSSPGEVVKPGTPTALPALEEPADRELNRLDLARWMTRPDHPLTARVEVNRVWEAFFGKGLASSSADFGIQSTLPTHPELLDWLATDFVTGGWDVKRLIRGIVTSRTYRQGAAAGPELLKKDPRNELLARGPRFRLSAEQIRDQALMVSGLLVGRLGGPSVKPYQPGDLWRQISHYGSSPATSQTFVQDHGEKLYRRSLYTYWKRTLPPPNLAVFDAPNREVCAIGRAITNTPLQALVTLNDPQFVEAARKFAGVLAAARDSDEARIADGFERVTGRPPVVQEMTVLLGALGRERTRYAADPAAAAALLAVGESPVDPSLDPVEHAALAQVCSMLLNLSETLTRP